MKKISILPTDIYHPVLDCRDWIYAGNAKVYRYLITHLGQDISYDRVSFYQTQTKHYGIPRIHTPTIVEFPKVNPCRPRDILYRSRSSESSFTRIYSFGKTNLDHRIIRVISRTAAGYNTIIFFFCDSVVFVFCFSSFLTVSSRG